MDDLWQRRRTRAVQLLTEAPHAESMLEFYVGLVEAQARVAARVVELTEEARGGEWPLSHLGPSYSEFMRTVEEIGTTVMAEAARVLAEGGPDRAAGILAGLGENGADDGNINGERIPMGESPERLLAAAFFQPVAVEQASSDVSADVSAETSDDGRICPRCHSEPVVAVLRDDPDALGRRLLVCRMCATEWAFPRLTCAYCRETDPEQLEVHQPESTPHIRVEECKSCGRYLKSIDLRKDGAAEPIVDELASVELDVWARERGLEKLSRNVLGL